MDGLGAPFIWVPRGKHGNYPSQSVCESGITLEDCEYDSPMGFPAMYVQQNIGSRQHPFRDCDYAFSGSTMTNPMAYECMWSFDNTEAPPLGRFNGWQVEANGPAPKPYGWLLSLFGF